MKFTATDDARIQWLYHGLTEFKVMVAEDELTDSGTSCLYLELRCLDYDTLITDRIDEHDNLKIIHFLKAIGREDLWQTGKINPDDCVSHSGQLYFDSSYQDGTYHLKVRQYYSGKTINTAFEQQCHSMLSSMSQRLNDIYQKECLCSNNSHIELEKFSKMLPVMIMTHLNLEKIELGEIYHQVIQQIDAAIIFIAMLMCNGNQEIIAEALGLNRQELQQKLIEHEFLCKQITSMMNKTSEIDTIFTRNHEKILYPNQLKK